MVVLDLLLINLIVVLIVDLSGFMTDFKKLVWRVLFKSAYQDSFRIKPFDCSLCMTFWISLIYLVCINQFSLINILVVLVLSYLTTTEALLLRAVKALLDKLISKVF